MSVQKKKRNLSKNTRYDVKNGLSLRHGQNHERAGKNLVREAIKSSFIIMVFIQNISARL